MMTSTVELQERTTTQTNFDLQMRERTARGLRKTADTGLFMGRSLYNRFDLVYLRGNTGMLTVGGARGGKTACCSIPNLLTWRHSAFVIDVKGSHAAVTAPYRREVLGQDVYIVDAFNVLGQGTDGFKSLDINPDAPDVREQINAHADALVVPDPDSREKHWDDGARTIIAGLIDHLVSSHREPSLPMLRGLLTQMPEEQKALWANMAVNESLGGAARDAATRIIRGFDTNEILGLLSNADKHTEWLSSKPIQDVLSKRSFSFAQLKQKPTTIYLVIPPHYLNIHKRLLRLFVNQAINAMSVGGRSPIPVLGLCDEFLQYGFMSEILKAFSLMQGYNLMLWPFIQDLKTAKHLYGDSFNAIINNCRAVQTFAVSDEESTRFTSDRIGPRSMRYVWGTNSFGAPPPLRNPTEVAREVYADGGLQYILRAGGAPLLLKKVPYFEDKLDAKWNASMPAWLMQRLYPFWGKYDPDPDYR